MGRGMCIYALFNVKLDLLQVNLPREGNRLKIMS